MGKAIVLPQFSLILHKYIHLLLRIVKRYRQKKSLFIKM